MTWHWLSWDLTEDFGSSVLIMCVKVVQRTSLIWTPSTRVFHSGSGAVGESWRHLSEARCRTSAIKEADFGPEEPIEQNVYGYDVTESKTERMKPSAVDADPSGWRDYQQEVRLYKTGENLEVNWSVAARLVGGDESAWR